MAGLAKHFDPPSLLVITITAALFMLALLVKGLTHDMLLEAGVLMISIKLVLMAYKNSVAMLSILRSSRTCGPCLSARSLPNPKRPDTPISAAKGGDALSPLRRRFPPARGTSSEVRPS